MYKLGMESGKKEKLKSFATFLIGIITFFTGFVMWRNPHTNWESLKSSGKDIAEFIRADISRLPNDPFAAVGVLIMIGGLMIIYESRK